MEAEEDGGRVGGKADEWERDQRGQGGGVGVPLVEVSDWVRIPNLKRLLRRVIVYGNGNH